MTFATTEELSVESQPNTQAKGKLDLRSPWPAYAESTRKELLHHETYIRSVGNLYLAFFTLSSLAAIVALGLILSGRSFTIQTFGLAAVCGLWGWLLYSLGFGLRDLNEKIRTPVTVISAVGLIGWVVGLIGVAVGLISSALGLISPDPGLISSSAAGLITSFPFLLIHGYIVYLLHSEKGKRVMTPEYRSIVEQTPHIKYRTPAWLIALTLLILALLVGLFFPALGS